ncbi:DUF512 domain-containing protein [Oscillospiraceae bacterium WX1]
MGSVITGMTDNSPLAGRCLTVGDMLVRLNGHKIRDVLDYQYYSYDARLLLEAHSQDGTIKLIRVHKAPGEPLGLLFDDFLMDTARACVNRCVFCFVDQLPKNLRDSLYFKDDDIRLSFLMGNYVTLSNLTQADVDRFIAMRLSPLNISVHATDPACRSLLLGVKNAGRGLETMRAFAASGITMNCQIVVCPGLNDGAQLERTMADLTALYPYVASVSVVPVGLTKFRDGLYPLRPFDRQSAGETLAQVEKYANRCRRKLGTHLFYPADELYLKAGCAMPAEAFYEGYPQLENGVGMLRLFQVQAQSALKNASNPSGEAFTIATGHAAFPYLQKILNTAREKYANIKGKIIPVDNDFFGPSIDVAGLITGGDLIRRLHGQDLGKRLLLSQSMLRRGEAVFLDDVTVEDVSKVLGVSVRFVAQDGADFIRAICGE